MITLLKQSQGPLLVFEVSLKLSARDYEEHFAPALAQATTDHTRARLVIVFGEDFTGWDPGAIWDDARFGMHHHSDFERLAVVGDPRWIQWSTNIASALYHGEVRSFAPGTVEAAVAWAHEA